MNNAMGLRLQPQRPLFAVELGGINLRQTFGKEQIDEIVAALEKFAVGIVRQDAPLTDAEHIAFSLHLGPIERKNVLTVSNSGKNRLANFEIIDQSNLDETGNIYSDTDRRLAFKRANRLWHTDMSFHSNRATYSLLSAVLLPFDGGPKTEFTDMRAAYDALSQKMKNLLTGLVAEHSYWYSRVEGGGPTPTTEELSSRPPAQHSLVHERGGRKALYLASHASHIVGWSLDESRELLDELMTFATQKQFIYEHSWQTGDVVIWDNLATMHRARPFDDRVEVRDVRRTTCREIDPLTIEGN